MSIPIVIADTFKIRLLWPTYNGVKPVNVFHLETPSGTVSQIAAAISANLTANMFDPMSQGRVLSLIGITPLDGTTAESLHPVTPVHGNDNSQEMPAVACVLSMRSLRRGSRGRGRLFLGPVCEASLTNGIMVNSNDIAAPWGVFNNALIASAAAARLVVASYKHLATEQVVSLTQDHAACTQRRRQSQLH